MSPLIPFLAMDSPLPVHVAGADNGLNNSDAEFGTSSLPVRLLPMHALFSVISLLRKVCL